MKTYKDPAGKLHAIDAQYEYMLPAGSVQISDEEADALRDAERAADAVVQKSPEEKLREFFTANPDVAALVDHG